MPFKSQAQARFLFQNHPDIANRWQSEYQQRIVELPEHVKKKKPKTKKK